MTDAVFSKWGNVSLVIIVSLYRRKEIKSNFISLCCKSRTQLQLTASVNNSIATNRKLKSDFCFCRLSEVKFAHLGFYLFSSCKCSKCLSGANTVSLYIISLYFLTTCTQGYRQRLKNYIPLLEIEVSLIKFEKARSSLRTEALEPIIQFIYRLKVFPFSRILLKIKKKQSISIQK